MRPKTIYLHQAAPPKPAEGAPCNGCGVCCASAPCPLGMLVSLRRTGPCKALQWSAADGRYNCGLVVDVADWLPGALRGLSRPARWLVRRWIAAGQGCDSDLTSC
jgi:hypothetical protein